MTFQEQLAKADNEYITNIGSFLEDRAKIDPSVARNLEKESKSLLKCFQYIIDEAKKQKRGSCAMVRDDIVYGWAIHYYDEDDLSIDKKIESKNTKEVQKPKVENKPIKEESKVASSIKKTKVTDEQLSLF